MAPNDLLPRLRGLRVTVTDEDLALGKANNNAHCPEALALVRVLDEHGLQAKRPRVAYDSIRFSIDGQRFEVPTPPEATRLQKRLDARNVMPPHELVLKDVFVIQREPRRLAPERIGRWNGVRRVKQPGKSLHRNPNVPVGGL